MSHRRRSALSGHLPCRRVHLTLQELGWTFPGLHWSAEVSSRPVPVQVPSQEDQPYGFILETQNSHFSSLAPGRRFINPAQILFLSRPESSAEKRFCFLKSSNENKTKLETRTARFVIVFLKGSRGSRVSSPGPRGEASLSGCIPVSPAVI